MINFVDRLWVFVCQYMTSFDGKINKKARFKRNISPKINIIRPQFAKTKKNCLNQLNFLIYLAFKNEMALVDLRTLFYLCLLLFRTFSQHVANQLWYRKLIGNLSSHAEWNKACYQWVSVSQPRTKPGATRSSWKI